MEYRCVDTDKAFDDTMTTHTVFTSGIIEAVYVKDGLMCYCEVESTAMIVWEEV